MRDFSIILFFAITLAFTPLQTVGQTNSVEPQPYFRIAQGTNTVQLQIALRKFVPAQNSGPAVWLAAVMHIGEPRYYTALQHFLAAQTVVLYEGINPDAHPRHFHDFEITATNSPPEAKPLDTNSDYSLQSALAKSLGLVFQLEAIDYDRTNFVNSDLSISQIQHIMQSSGPLSSTTNGSFDMLLQLMDGSSFLGSLVKAGLQFVGSNPQLQAGLKLGLIEAVGQLKGDLSDMQGLPPDWQQLVKVLIEARNKNLLDDLAVELKKLPPSGSVAVFYGAGHMDDMEKHLRRELHYRPVSDIWLSAFSIDMAKSGITPDEAEWMGKMIEGQMKQMQTLGNH